MDRRTQRPRDGEQSYVYYTRYPDGIGAKYAEDLKCPACGSDQITVLNEFEFGAVGMLGDTAQCWICKVEFTVTENCWKPRRIKE